jgi:hypothetical protein
MTGERERNVRCRVKARVVPESEDTKTLLERIRVECPVTGEERLGVECARCLRLVGWGISTGMGEPWLTCRVPCASCGGNHAAATNADFVICEECAERAADAEEDDDLGVGD